MELDTKDKKILSELCKNARTPSTKIAKAAGLSREVVDYRIKSMIKKGIIQSFITLVDTSKLGYSAYTLFLQLQNSDENIEAKIMSYLQKQPSILFISKSLGGWDIAVIFCAKNIEEFNSIITNISKTFSKYIRNLDTLVNKCEYSAVIPKIIQKTEFIEIPEISKETVEIDKKDIKILEALADNARAKIVDISKDLNISSDSVIYRIRNLSKRGIIKGFRPVINTSKFKCLRYVIVFELQSSKTEKEKNEFIGFLKELLYTSYIFECIGKYEIYVYFVIKEPENLRNILMEIKNKFTKLVKDYIILHMFEEYKNDYFSVGLFR